MLWQNFANWFGRLKDVDNQTQRPQFLGPPGIDASLPAAGDGDEQDYSVILRR